MDEPPHSKGCPEGWVEGSPERPALSVVVATRQAWPGLRGLLDSLLKQAAEVGAEVVIADGGEGALAETEPPAGLVWLREPGSSVLRLRALGLAAARGEVVALTEDHCRVDRDWCRRILAGHRARPEVAAIGGAVENGAGGTMTSRLHFLTAYGVFLPPLPDGDADFVPGEANVSYKRWALPAEAARDGVQQMLHNQRLLAGGRCLLLDDRIVVVHDQPLGLAAACLMHFHNGRCIAGFRRPTLSLTGLLARLASCLVLPPFLTLRALLAAFRKRRERAVAVLGLPILLALSCCHGLGECLGYLRGPGDSPLKVA